jgi:hypothetical protein
MVCGSLMPDNCSARPRALKVIDTEKRRQTPKLGIQGAVKRRCEGVKGSLAA